MKDPLQQFTRLREALVAEKATIEARLAAINAVLEPGAAPAKAVTLTKAAWRSLDKITADYLEKDLGGYTPRKGSLPAKILRTLDKSGAPMQVKDIAAAVKGKAMLVNQACLMLLKKCRLRREGKGQYSLA